MLPAKDSIDIHIFYRQRSTANNKYILTSTQSWGKPLKKAVYVLTVKGEMKVKHFSYSPDMLRETSDVKVYYWEKRYFMPDADFEVILDTQI